MPIPSLGGGCTFWLALALVERFWWLRFQATRLNQTPPGPPDFSLGISAQLFVRIADVIKARCSLQTLLALGTTRCSISVSFFFFSIVWLLHDSGNWLVKLRHVREALRAFRSGCRSSEDSGHSKKNYLLTTEQRKGSSVLLLFFWRPDSWGAPRKSVSELSAEGC